MLTDHYGAYGIRLRTPRLELRLPDLDDLAALADVAIEGVHDPADMPFLVPWTDAEPAVRGRSVITYNLGVLAAATTAKWNLPAGRRVASRVRGTGCGGGGFGRARQQRGVGWRVTQARLRR